MFRVVIVDDEPSVLEGLRLFVDWTREGFEIVGEASDGRAAFPIIRENHPDLVICDIRMPGLSGLELLEKVKASGVTTPKFVMLSGYSDFTYARKALELGAAGYLTKPLDSDELSAELSRIANIIRNEQKNNFDSIEMIRYAANQVYNDILSGKHTERLARKAEFIYGIPEVSSVRIVRFVTEPKSDSAIISPDVVYDFLTNTTEVENENCIFYNGNGVYVIILHKGMKFFSAVKDLERRFSVYDTIPGTEHAFWVFISAASDRDILKGICDCDRQTDLLHTFCMLHPENRVLCHESFREKNSSESDLEAVLPEQSFNKVIAAIQGNDSGAIEPAVEAFFADLIKMARKEPLFSICLYRLADVVRKAASAYGVEAGKLILDFTNAVSARSPKCKELALTMCRHVFRRINSHNDKPIVQLENEILDYIKAGFRKSNLSIQSIADAFSIPTPIISKIVKKKTGHKFNDYVNYLRIEHAKTLFATEDMKITAVCEQAGYSDYGYFTKKFKELTGVLPSEYKKRYS